MNDDEYKLPMGRSKDPNPVPIGVYLVVLFTLAFFVGVAILAYYSFGECTRIHPVWYCFFK